VLAGRSTLASGGTMRWNDSNTPVRARDRWQPGRLPVATLAFDDRRTAPAVGRCHPDQRNHESKQASNHQHVADDVPVDVRRMQGDCEPENRAGCDQDDGGSNAHVCPLDPTARHVAPDEQRQRDNRENDQDCDQHESPFFDVSERLALVRPPRYGAKTNARRRKSDAEPGDDDKVQAGERKVTLACAA